MLCVVAVLLTQTGTVCVDAGAGAEDQQRAAVRLMWVAPALMRCRKHVELSHAELEMVRRDILMLRQVSSCWHG